MFAINEELPTLPEDIYVISKLVNEATAKSFQRSGGKHICGLGINKMIEPYEYANTFPTFIKNPDPTEINIFSY